MDFTDKQIRPPKSWQKFEDICLDIFKHVWADPLARKNGRTGQPQHGTDIYSSAASGLGQRGVQCKGKDEAYDARLTLAEFKRELAKAEKFKPGLQAWVLATSGPKDAALEEKVRLISAARQAQGKFPVDVLAWEDLQSLIGDHDAILAKHYPEHRPAAAQVEERFLASAETLERLATSLQAAADPLIAIATADSPKAGAPADAALNARIDEVRDWLNRGRPTVALEALAEIEQRFWGEAGDWPRFRILTNRGAAYLELGEQSSAADEFIKAHAFAPADPKAGTNLALAYHLKGQNEEAREAAWKVVAAHPTNSDAFAIWIRTVEDDPEVENPLSAAPEGMGLTGSVYGAAAHFHRKRGNPERALQVLREGVQASPDSTILGAELATSLLEAVMGDSRAQYGRRLSAEHDAMVAEATGLLRRYVDKHGRGEITPITLAYSTNLVCALRMADDTAGATTVLEELLKRAPQEAALLQEQVRLRLIAHEFDQAISLAQSVKQPSPELQRMLAEALAASGRHAEATVAHQAAIAAASEPEASEFRTDLPRFLWAEGRKEEARAMAEALAAERPDDPHVLITLSEICWREDDNAAASVHARRALELAAQDDALTRLHAAEALFQAEDFDGAAAAFRDCAGLDRDNQALRRLLSCLLASDRRREAHDLLEELPEAVRSLPPYLRAAALLAEDYGDLPGARAHFEAYLSVVPQDHAARLTWLGVLNRLEARGALREFLTQNSELVGAKADHQMAYAHVLSRHGEGLAALRLAYRTLRENYGLSRMHMGYIGLIVNAGAASSALRDLRQIQNGAAFSLKLDDDGQVRTFVIEADYPPDPSRGEIGPDSPVAQAALGKKKRQVVELPGGPLSQTGRVTEVKDKHLHQFHQSMNNFNAMFPDEPGFIGMKFNKKQPEKTIDRMRSIAEPRSTHVRNVADAYRDSDLPIGVVAKITGVDPIQAWHGLIALEVPIRVCAGTVQERDAARLSLRRSKGLIVDPLTLWIAGVLGVLDTLKTALGPLHITQSGLETMVVHAEELSHSAGKQSMSLGVIDGQLTRSIGTAEENQQAYDRAYAIVTWVKANVVLAPALPKKDFDGSLREICEAMDPAFGDTLRAANGLGLLLLCEDMNLRKIGSLVGVSGVWLQPALLEAAVRGRLEQDDYERLCRYLAEARHDHTSVNALTLMAALKAGDWDPNRSLAMVMRSLAGPHAELQSSIGVCGQFVASLWSRPTPPSARAATVKVVLSAYLPHHAAKVEAIADAILQQAELRLRRGADNLRHRTALRAAVRKWKAEALPAG